MQNSWPMAMDCRERPGAFLLHSQQPRWAIRISSFSRLYHRMDDSVLGKRAREEEKAVDVSKAAPNDEDDSDDDLGPMPMPAGGEENGGSKKKRKSA